MKEDWITAIITENFNESTKKVVGEGEIIQTNGGVEMAIAMLYVEYLESTGIVFEYENDGEKEELIDRIRKSLLKYKAKAKKGDWFDPFANM